MSLLREIIAKVHDGVGNAISSVNSALSVSLNDGLGNPINSLNGAIDVHDSHVHRVPINEFFHDHTGTTTTLAVAVTAGDTQITVVSSVGFLVGDTTQIQNGVIETTLPIITAIAVNVITLDRPLDNSFAIGDDVEIVVTNMNSVGTLTTPISYKVIPDLNQIWHIQSFIISMTHTTGGDDSRLGNIAGGVINGVVLRGYSGALGQYRTLTNWKQNKDIRLDAFNLNYSDKAGPGVYGTSADGAFLSRTGAVARVDGTAGDYIEILIQDDLSTLISFEVKAQGHIEGS